MTTNTEENETSIYITPHGIQAGACDRNPLRANRQFQALEQTPTGLYKGMQKQRSEQDKPRASTDSVKEKMLFQSIFGGFNGN
jgi:hypothetical protein